MPKMLLKHPLLYCTKSCVHCLLTYLAFLINKMELYRNAATKSLQKYCTILLFIWYLGKTLRLEYFCMYYNIWKQKSTKYLSIYTVSCGNFIHCLYAWKKIIAQKFYHVEIFLEGGKYPQTNIRDVENFDWINFQPI